MRAALRHRNRVRGISFGWTGVSQGVSFGNFLKATDYYFPALESLNIGFPYDLEPYIPATFLRRPDQSDLRLRSLTVDHPELPSHPYLDFRCPQRLSPTSLWALVINPGYIVCFYPPVRSPTFSQT